jgi:hypothetical protein
MDKLIKEIEKLNYKDISYLLEIAKKTQNRVNKIISQSDKQQLQVLKLKDQLEERNKK